MFVLAGVAASLVRIMGSRKFGTFVGDAGGAYAIASRVVRLAPPNAREWLTPGRRRIEPLPEPALTTPTRSTAPPAHRGSAPGTGDGAPAPLPPSRGRLLVVLGVGFGIAVTIGNTIGMGILRTPGDVATLLPAAWLYIGVWIVGGVYALLGANSVAELGTAIPRSGGMYVFVRRALGPYAGFVVGWNDWISTAGSAAAVALVIGEYGPALVPTLEGRMTEVALSAIAAFTILQWRGVRAASRTQEVTSALKGLLLVALVALFFLVEPAAPVRAEPVAAPGGFALFAAVILALQAVIYTYDGWTGVVYFGGEVKDPARDVPRSMIGGVLLITAIYLLLNLGYMYVLPVPAMAGEEFVAGRAAEAILGPTGERAVRGLIVLGMLSAVNALVMMASRVLHAMSADGLFARRGAQVNRGGTPTIALFLSALVAAAFILTGTVTQVVAVCAFFFVANYVLAFLSVIVLRRREPDLPRPFRAWGYPWTTVLVLAGSVAFLAGSVVGDTRQSLISLAIVAASWPVYRVMVKVTGR